MKKVATQASAADAGDAVDSLVGHESASFLSGKLVVSRLTEEDGGDHGQVAGGVGNHGCVERIEAQPAQGEAGTHCREQQNHERT